MQRYVVERGLAAGFTDADVDDAVRRVIVAAGRVPGVRWIHSNLALDRSKFFCEYEAPNEGAVRQAARLAAVPCDTVTPVREIDPEAYADSRL